MAQTYLIDESVIQQYRTISSSVNEAKRVTPFVYEAQVFDLKPLLGGVLYDDFVKNKALAKYVTLLNGEDYLDASGYSVHFEGVAPVLAYFAFARFLENQQITITSHSVVTKDSPYSTPVDSKILSQRVSQARSGALAYWEGVAKYLCDKSTTYPLWGKEISGKPRTSGARISSVDGFTRRFGTSTVHEIGCTCSLCQSK